MIEAIATCIVGAVIVVLFVLGHELLRWEEFE